MKKILVILFFLLIQLPCFSQETLTITTYYPSPTGAYQTIKLQPGDTPTYSPGLLFYDNDDAVDDGLIAGLYYCDSTSTPQLLGPDAGGSGAGLWSGDVTADMWNLNTGNVGIGTTSPLANLHVGNTTIRDNSNTRLLVGSSSPTNFIEINNNDATAGMLVGMNNATTGLIANDGNLWLSPGYTAKMAITSAGNVGIGTTSPAEKLTIEGASLSTIRLNNTASGLNWMDDMVQFFASSSTAAPQQKNFSICNRNPSVAGGENSLVWVGHNDDFSPGTFLMTLTHGGNLGIGTTAPTGRLHTKTSTDIEVARFEDEGGNAVVVDKDGRVGIGTTSPGSKLDVNGGLTLRSGNYNASNGNNNNISIGDRTFVRITGPTAAFKITGIANGSDGRVLILFNTTSNPMTIARDSVSSGPTNRIYTQSLSDITTTFQGAVILIYNSGSLHWEVINWLG